MCQIEYFIALVQESNGRAVDRCLKIAGAVRKIRASLNVIMSDHELSRFLRWSILNMCSAKYHGPGGSVSVFLPLTNERGLEPATHGVAIERDIGGVTTTLDANVHTNTLVIFSIAQRR